MPPAAISRSSTYLPKIWGNIARLHRSALGVALLLLGCSSETPESPILPIRAARPAGCGAGDPSTIKLEALGDFDPSPFTSETIIGPAPGGTPLGFPVATRAVEARGEGAGSRFLGLGELGPDGGIELLLLPEDAACELYRPGARPYPLASGGQALGISARHRVLLIAGGLAASGDSARALAVDLASGEASEVPSGMIPGRGFASITELGPDALLVAGGIDPTEGPVASAPALSTAIVYEVADHRFDRSALITLTKPRARHGAVVLGSGETLLVGGKSDVALASCEVISPVDRAARLSGVAGLQHARIAPSVLALDDGRVFVGGGVDDAAEPVSFLEWLSADASAHERALDAQLAADHAFAAMPGGSVLAIGVCPKAAPSCASSAISWIRADFVIDSIGALPFSPSAPVLIAAADGAPFLVASAPSGARVVLRFDPWQRRFVTPEEAPVAPPIGYAGPIAADPGMFVWLAPFGDALSVNTFRHGTRGAYARDVAPLVLGSAAHLAPDRAPLASSGVEYLSGRLVLTDNGGPPARAWITDATYETLRLEITLASGSPPRIALENQLFGDSGCPWPTSSEPVLVLERSAASVTLQRGPERTSCSVATGRVRVALVAPEAESSAIQSVIVSRSLP